MSIVERMNYYFQSLNANERETLHTILSNKQEFNDLTIDDFAKKCLVSKSFVMRLCKKLAYSGYSEFKYQLKAELDSHITQQSTQSIIETTQQDIAETLRLLDTKVLSEIGHLLDQANHIYTYGTGYGQKTILEDFKRGFISSRRVMTSLPSSVELRLNSEIMQKNDVLFIVSMSGQVDNIINELIHLKERGVYVISITQFSTNSLASLSSINLYLKSTPIPNPLAPETPYVSYSALCVLLDIIVKNYLNSSTKKK
ncbi:MurR/RpiR family transcriptional regulator [Enterococcus saccharolyticus]|uniref:MurR/RpiR family transcriptional regulator n=1 Tax=Candidatus Enterococcus willemsii TaxID=1857215 RepID=A0ABQ6YWV4_9ENTE|nr:MULTISPECIES: MurR/RpiR family transcriptional regulator [Enterococcus]KAF1301458.1 hypothetical protein BAU17_05920 [Enterococcus sp. CU12B]MCD5003106.1 MurR/RpiR family transcriptional regulator [Enterococcus saccharolyticus]